MPDVPLQQTLMSMGHALPTSDDIYTPRWVFERLGLTFDVDVCAPLGGVPWIPAHRYYTVADDGLAQSWQGRVWMNPPYSDATPWVRRFIAHGNGICLVPHARAQWHQHLWETAHGIAHPGRFYFHGDREIYFPVMFAAFGEECVEAISRVGAVRVRSDAS